MDASPVSIDEYGRLRFAPVVDNSDGLRERKIVPDSQKIFYIKTVRFVSILRIGGRHTSSRHRRTRSGLPRPVGNDTCVLVFEIFRNPYSLSSRHYCEKPLRFVRFKRVRAKIGCNIFSDRKPFVRIRAFRKVLSRYCDGHLTSDRIRGAL